MENHVIHPIYLTLKKEPPQSATAGLSRAATARSHLHRTASTCDAFPQTGRNNISQAQSQGSPRASTSATITLNNNDFDVDNHSPRRQRARTKPNINMPFMLPPPVHGPSSQQNNVVQQAPKLDNLPRKSMPYLPSMQYNNDHNKSSNLIHQSVTEAVNDTLILSPGNNSNKVRSKSFAAPSSGKYHEDANNDDNRSKDTMYRPSFTQIPGPRPHVQAQQHKQSQQHHNKLNRNRLSYSPNMMAAKSRSQNSSPRYSHQLNKKFVKKTRFSTNDVKNGRKKGNYLESVGVIRIIEHKIFRMIEINTENDFKIRCTPMHLFWISGKGWGCVDAKKRVKMEQAVALQNKNNHKSNKKVKMPHIIHELQKGEQLLSVGGNKYRISNVNIISKPKGLLVYGIVVNKNECFFANDLLVKNSIL